MIGRLGNDGSENRFIPVLLKIRHGWSQINKSASMERIYSCGSERSRAQ